MVSALKDVFKAEETWPKEDQQALLGVAGEIEAPRLRVHRATADDLAAFDRGVEAARSGRP